MYAFGDGLLFIAVFSAVALFPTGLALYFLQPCRWFWVVLSVPLLTPYLSSLWLGLVTPVYARMGRNLVESMRNPIVVCDPSARDVFPLRPRPLREAIERAMANQDRAMAAARWSDTLSSGGAIKSWGSVRFGTWIVDSRTAEIKFRRI
jgi:hypothetical protein